MLVQKDDSTKLYLIDSSNYGLVPSKGLSAGYECCTNPMQMEEMITDIVKELIMRQEMLKRGEWQCEQYAQLCLLIDDIREFLDAMTDKTAKMVQAIVGNGKGLGILIIVAGKASDINMLSGANPIVVKILFGQNGLVLSGVPAQYSYFQGMLSLEARTKELADGDGLIYQQGNVQRIRLVKE